MTDAKQNRPDSRAANVDSVGAGTTIKNTQVEHIAFLTLPSITRFHAEVFVPGPIPQLRLGRLTSQKIIDYASTPNLKDFPGRGADLFRKVIHPDWSFIYWPDGVAIVVNSREITAVEGVALYNAARSVLESHLNGA